MNVAELLAKSRAAHAAYRSNAGRINKDGGVVIDAGNKPAAREAVRTARDLRALAHSEDPEHTDPAWAHDLGSHVDLMAFYDKYLAT